MAGLLHLTKHCRAHLPAQYCRTQCYKLAAYKGSHVQARVVSTHSAAFSRPPALLETI